MSFDTFVQKLEVYIQSTKFENFYAQLKSDIPILANFSSPPVLKEFIEDKDGDFEKKDAILCALIRKYQRNDEHAESLSTLLTYLLISVIKREYFLLKAKGNWLNDLKDTVTWSFLNVLWEYPVSRRLHKVKANIYWEMHKKVCRWLTDEYSWLNQQEMLEEDLPEESKPKWEMIKGKRVDAKNVSLPTVAPFGKITPWTGEIALKNCLIDLL